MIEATVLIGERVVLEPLHISHVDDLVRAATVDRTTFTYTFVPESTERMKWFVELLLDNADKGLVVPYVQVDAHTQRVVGMTRFLTIRSRDPEGAPYAVEIGGTWLEPSAQRTGLNVEAKYLLLTQAFDVWKVERVDIKTDARNDRSRTAISNIGAKFEGVLRSWQESQVVGEEHLLRDTAMFSITADEWPTVRSHLLARLNRPSA